MLVLLASCGEVHTELVPASLGSSAPPDASMPVSDAGMHAMCGRKVCKCDDGMDNDHDALIDGLDPECTARFDDDEETFATGGPKKPAAMCEDCFWDDNADPADDGCAYPTACRNEGPMAMPAMPMGPMMMGAMCSTCEVTPRCIDTCRSHTPNGCDCFGCCEVTKLDGTLAHVVLGDECSLAKIDDTHKCPACVPSPACANPCGPCELCLGKHAEDLPPDCAGVEPRDAGAPSQCDDGYQACSEDGTCPDDYYCVLGCCLVTLF
jgi:hypothetical protein